VFIQILPVDLLTLQELRQREGATFSKLASCSPILRITIGRPEDLHETTDAEVAESSSPARKHRDQGGTDPGPVKLEVPIPPATTGTKSRNGRPHTATGSRPLAAASANSAAGNACVKLAIKIKNKHNLRKLVLERGEFMLVQRVDHLAVQT